METKLMLLVLNVFCAVFISGATLKEGADVADSTNVNSTDIKDPIMYLETPNNTDSQSSWRPVLNVQLPYAGAQCSCEDQKCKCCASIHVQAFGYEREACATMNYRPSNKIGLDVAVNNATVFRNTISTHDTKLICVPMTTYLPVGPLDFCIKLFDISVVERKLHICMNMMTRISEKPVLLLQFDCMNIDGIGAEAENQSPNATLADEVSVSTQDSPILETTVNKLLLRP